MQNEVTIVGFGKMGSAIAEFLSQKNWKISVFDPYFSGELPQNFTRLSQLAKIQTPAILLCVKPVEITKVLQEIPSAKTVISIAAGVSTESMQQVYQGNIVRVMPNTPARIGFGISGIYFGKLVESEIRKFCLQLFSCIGEIVEVSKESDLHAVTALSGSGPAYIELMAAALEDAGVQAGLQRDTSRRLAIATIRGTAELMRQDTRSPQEMIHDVTSPGGTTIAAISALKKGGFESTVQNAVNEAIKRSIEISNS